MKPKIGKAAARDRAMLALRAAAIGLAALAGLGLRIPLPTRARTVVVLIDVSASVGREGIEASRTAALALIRKLEAGDRAAAAVFAEKPVVIFPPMEPEQAASLLESAELSIASADATDIGSALAVARELASEGEGTRNVYLFSDGRSNAGSPPSENVPSVSRATFTAVAAGGARTGLVSAGLETPSVVRSDETAALSWKLFSDSDRGIRYSLFMDERMVASGAAALVPGVNELRVEVNAGASGIKALRIEATAADDDIPLAGGGAFLEVAGPAKVLVVAGSGFSSGKAEVSPLADVFRAQGMNVVSGGPASLPETAMDYAGIAAVVLDDLPALAITETQQRLLLEYVAGGGGVLVIGGESSLGRGDYYATPLEDMLPVETDSRRRLQFTRAKLLFVIDHSGSMSESVGGTTKRLAAMRGVAAAITRLNRLDEVGIIGFDTTPTWVLPFAPATESRKILDALAELGDGGGTDLAAALAEAIKGFGAAGPTKRHAIILTDGVTNEADFASLTAKFVAIGASASTIAIGESINEELLKAIAVGSGGRYYRAEGDRIPAVIDEETIKMTREHIEEGRIATRIVSNSSFVQGLGNALPRVGGYLRTTAKSLASVDIEARAENSPGERSWDPLLVSWRYGNGRAAVFTADSGRRWLSDWSLSPVYNRLWVQALRSIARAVPDGSLRPRAVAEAGGIRVVVDAVGSDRRSLSALRLVGAVLGEDASFGFKETAPGRYEGFVPIKGSGLFGIDLFDPISRSAGFAWAWKEPLSEAPNLGPDLSTLSLIASANGGELVSADRLVPPPVTTSWNGRSIRSLLLVLAAFLLLADLFLRSTMAGQLERARVAFAAWWLRQRTDAALARGAVARGTVSSEDTPGMDSQREARFFEIRRRLAERTTKRLSDAKDNFGANGTTND